MVEERDEREHPIAFGSIRSRVVSVDRPKALCKRNELIADYPPKRSSRWQCPTITGGKAGGTGSGVKKSGNKIRKGKQKLEVFQEWSLPLRKRSKNRMCRTGRT